MNHLQYIFYKLQIFARQHIGNKIYFLGPPHVGKTTLVEELRKRQNELHIQDSLKHTRSRNITFQEAISKVEYTAFDAGGEPIYRHLWFETIKKHPPIGLVFVIDHKQKQDANNDLTQLLGLFEDIKLNQPTMAITRGILVFINKYDLWKNKISPQEIITPIKDLISQFKQIGINPIIRWGSARYYQEYHELLDDSFSDFHRLLFDPYSKVSKWPAKL